MRHAQSLIFRLLMISAAFLLHTPTIAYEQPKYKVIENVGAIELRQYEPFIVAEVETTGERDAAIGAGFRILAGYIFGGNTAQKKIAMTAPVTQSESESPKDSQKIAMTAPVMQTEVGSAGPNADKRWRVTFMMPSEFTLESLPTPTDKRVRFATEPARKRVSIQFDGFSTRSNLESNRAKLEAFVKERALATVGAYTVAFYNDPFTLPWNRRNEWWVEVK
jgi:hypothetical protein